MRKVDIKFTGAVVVFSIIITLLFSFVLMFSQSNSINSMETTTGGLLVISEKNAKGVIDKIEADELPANILKGTSEYNKSIVNRVYNDIILKSAVFFVLLFVSSVLLIYFLKNVQNKEDDRILRELIEISDGKKIIKSDSKFEKVYKKIEGIYEENLNNYIRLNSYLSHEQKNEIAILKTRMEVENNKEYINSIDTITSNINDIIILGEINHNGVDSKVDIVLICAEIVDKYKKIERNINFEFEESDIKILAKKHWIYRAISNILDNAIKYGQGNPIDISVRSEKNTVIIKISDKGIGIDKTHIDKIYNNNYRINELKKDGYGIGLSLVYHVCDLCGGFIWCESKVDEGTTFYLSFPLANGER